MKATYMDKQVADVMPWTVGNAAELKSTDRRYETEEEAIAAATKLHERHGFYSTVVIWNRDDEPEYVFTLGEQFRKV